MNHDDTPLTIADRIPSIWVTLSGGGFRAALFHLGCLKRLREAGLLSEARTMFSATSGGAFFAALLSLHRGWSRVNWQYDWEAFETHLLDVVMRGVLGPTTFLLLVYATYASAIALALGSWPLVATIVAIAAVLLHGLLAMVLIRSGALRPLEGEMFVAKFEAIPLPSFRIRLTRLLKMVLVPSYTRLQTMHFSVFKGAPVQHLNSTMFLTATELTTNTEWVFSQNVIAPLMELTDLWNQHPNDSYIPTKEVPLAVAVAASSAYPPFFKPVRLAFGRSTWCFVDGGVVDNLASKIPLAFSIDIHKSRIRFEGDSFNDIFRGIFFLDGGASDAEPTAAMGRIRSLFRVVGAIGDQQRSDATLVVGNFDRNIQIPAQVLSLWSGFVANPPGLPEELSPYLSTLGSLLGKVRTHFDSFSAAECAMLMYAGYTKADALIRTQKHIWPVETIADLPPAKCLTDMLPAKYGEWYRGAQDLVWHLTWSHLRLRPVRWLMRALA